MRRPARAGQGLSVSYGLSTIYISLIVLLPMAALVWRSGEGGAAQFLRAITSPLAISSLGFTFAVSLIVVLVNAITGTLIAWVLVRDRFAGKSIVNALIDLPFALPTIVAGLTLIALYGPLSPVGINIAYTRAAVLLALLFVTLPFVVRSVQPVLMELDRDMEEAAASLGASSVTTFRSIVLPNLLPAIVSGSALGFARAIGEFGSIVLLSGNIPFSTMVASVHVFGLIENEAVTSAAAVSVLLLVLSLLVLFGLNLIQRWGARHEG